MRFIIALIALILISTAHAEPRFYGIDQLGGGKYGPTIIESHPIGFALGIFTQKELFGDAYPVVDRAIPARHIPLVRYDLRWSDTHSFSRSDFPLIIAEAKRGLYVVNKYPNVECEFSGAVEHQFNERDATELARQVLAVIPERCIYVNTPWTGHGAFIAPGPRIKNEVHGGDAQKPKVGGKYNFSFDGTDAFDVDVSRVKQRLIDADVFFWWTSQNNGRRNASDNTPRQQRIFWPTGNLLRAISFLSTAQGSVSLPMGYLVKPKSDQHAVPPQPRELKPVIITPPSVRVLQLRRNGKVFDAGKPQPFVDGRVRFYLPQYGYEVGGVADVIANGKKVGTANPGFRQGAEHK